ncbi:MAG: zinc ribbon domain-containing protein [Lachnospiraceae bacterium]|nr:zinc ribbon domain-containing protein [Lachnospiraceae bacterium]
MFCNQCGKPLPEGAAFCPECGAVRETEPEAVKESAAKTEPEQISAPMQNMAFNPIPAENKEKQKKKGFPFKILVPAAVVFAVLVAILVIFLTAGRKTGMDTYADKKDYIETFISFENGMYEGEVSSYRGLGNGEKSIFVYAEDTALYYMKSDLEPKLIAEGYIGTYAVSYTGEYIAYVLADSMMEGDLYLYCVKDGKITQIDTDVFPGYICLSPEGKAIAYLKNYESYTENDLYIGGVGIKNQKVDDDGSMPVAISNNGKIFYYIDDSSKLYIYNGKNSEKVSSSGCSNFFVNKDVSEILYTKDGKTYYHTPKMEDPVKISNEELYSVVLPENVISFEDVRIGSTIVGVKSFKGGVLELSDGLYWFNDKGTDTIKICSTIYDYKLSGDGKSILFIKSGDLYKIKKIGDNMEAELLYDEKYVDYVVASDDLSKIYIVVEEEELLYLKGKNKTERITNDLSQDDYYSYIIAYNEDMKKIFFIENDTLYYAGTNAKSKVKVMEDVYIVGRILNMVVFVKDDDDVDIGYYMNSKEPVRIYEAE